MTTIREEVLKFMREHQDAPFSFHTVTVIYRHKGVRAVMDVDSPEACVYLRYGKLTTAKLTVGYYLLDANQWVLADDFEAAYKNWASRAKAQLKALRDNPNISATGLKLAAIPKGKKGGAGQRSTGYTYKQNTPMPYHGGAGGVY